MEKLVDKRGSPGGQDLRRVGQRISGPETRRDLSTTVRVFPTDSRRAELTGIALVDDEEALPYRA